MTVAIPHSSLSGRDVTGTGATVVSAVVGSAVGLGTFAAVGNPATAIAFGVLGFFASILGFKAYRATQKMAPTSALTNG